MGAPLKHIALVTREEHTAWMNRMFPIKGHFSKIRKHNQPIRYIEIKRKLAK